MGKHSSEYALLLIVISVLAYLVGTAAADFTSTKMKETAAMLEKYDG